MSGAESEEEIELGCLMLRRSQMSRDRMSRLLSQMPELGDLELNALSIIVRKRRTQEIEKQGT